MKDWFNEFAKGGAASAAKLVTALMAAYALYCQFAGKEARQIDTGQLTILATAIFAILAAHFDAAKVKQERKITAVVRDAAHAVNAGKIEELKAVVGGVAESVQVVAAVTGTDLNVPAYTPTPPPAAHVAPVAAPENLQAILEKAKVQ